MIFHFRKQKTNPSAAIILYRRCMEVIQQLQPSHQKTWYDYVRLKYEENAGLKDAAVIKKTIDSAYEELDWVQSVLNRRNAFRGPR